MLPPLSLSGSSQKAPGQKASNKACLSARGPPQLPHVRLPRGHELGGICRQITERLAVRAARGRPFCFAGYDHNGQVSRVQVREFFHELRLPVAAADQFFDFIDKGGSGVIDYNEFLRYTGQHILPGRRHPKSSIESVPPAPAFSRRQIRPPHALPGGEATPRQEDSKRPQQALPGADAAMMEATLDKILKLLGEKLRLRFTKTQEVFLFFDYDHDGSISRPEIRRCFEVLNLPIAMAEQLFNHLDKDGSGSVDYNEFLRFTGPYILPGHTKLSDR